MLLGRKTTNKQNNYIYTYTEVARLSAEIHQHLCLLCDSYCSFLFTHCLTDICLCPLEFFDPATSEVRTGARAILVTSQWCPSYLVDITWVAPSPDIPHSHINIEPESTMHRPILVIPSVRLGGNTNINVVSLWFDSVRYGSKVLTHGICLLVVIWCHINSISVISWWWYDVWDEEKAQAYTLIDSRDPWPPTP